MQSPAFDDVFALLSAVTPTGAELARLREWIAGIHDPAECLALIEAAAAGRPCPHCNGARIHKCGAASGLQRYRCLGCRRTYNALTGTPLARLRKRERWLPYCDRSGQTLDFHTGRGPVTVAQLHACLAGVLPSDVLLISDSAAAYARFAAAARITHEAVNVSAGRRARGAIHIQNVNGWHSRFKGWLARFKGVASRYLVHYSGWQRLLDGHELQTPAQWLCAAVRQS